MERDIRASLPYAKDQGLMIPRSGVERKGPPLRLSEGARIADSLILGSAFLSV